LDRIRAFMHSRGTSSGLPQAAIIDTMTSPSRTSPLPPKRALTTGSPANPPPPGMEDDPQRNFRFFDNRQKYLLFVNTCSEKWVVANRVSLELANIHPRP